MENDHNPINESYERNKGTYGLLQKAENAASTAAQSIPSVQNVASAEKLNSNGPGFISSVTGNKSPQKVSGLKKKAPAIAILLILIVAIGGIAFISQSFQLVSLFEQIKRDDNKLSATVYNRTETNTLARLQSNDPADRLSDYMIALFEDNGFDYVENDNGDGTVARGLIFNGDSTSLIASASARDTVMSALASTGSIIDSFRDVATVPNGEDPVAAAWYGALSVVAAGAWFDDDIALTYDRLGISPAKYGGLDGNITKEEWYTATKNGSIDEGANNTTGTTYRYVWQEHPYTHCDAIVGEVCVNPKDVSCWDWDSNHDWDNGKYTVYYYINYKQPSRKYDTQSGSCYYSAATPTPFTGEDTKTAISVEDDSSAINDALTHRSVLSAFSTNPKYENQPLPGVAYKTASSAAKNSSNSVADDKSENSIASIISSMVKKRSLNIFQSNATAVDQLKSQDGGMPMSLWGDIWNTPAESCGAGKNANVCSTMAAAASTSFNSWFSDDVKVGKDNVIVQKYNTALSLDEKDIDTKLINNEINGNYNNHDNTAANVRVAENMDNSYSEPGDDSELFYYCQESSGSDNAACPSGYSLDPGNYAVSGEVAEYVYNFTSIDLAKDPAGEETAVAFNLGANQLNDDALRQSSGAYGSEASTLAFYQMTQDYQAKVANYDRHTKSPFDASSPNTFLGSIVSSLLPFATSSDNALLTAVSASFSTIGNSISGLSPSASALDAFSYLHVETSSEYCISSESSDMVCDLYGQPITIMEMDYMDADEDEIINYMIEGNYIEEVEETTAVLDNTGVMLAANTFSSPKTYKVVERDDNPYAEWLLCTNNNSTINNSTTRETDAGKKTGFFEKIFAALKKLFGIREKQIRTQSSCGGDYGARLGGDAATEDMFKHFSQFTLDQRVRTLSGYQSQSASTAFMQKYYEENPLDQSYEAVIARLSGLTTEDVIAALNYMENVVYIAHYDPAARYQFIDGLFYTEEVSFDSDDPEDPFAVAAVVGKLREYEELRSRSFAV